MSEETLKILVPAFTAILGIFIGYFLKKSEYERQRRDELADRGFNRRAEIYDRRIQEARDTLENWSYTNSLLALYASLTRQGEWNAVIQLLKDYSAQISSLKILEDSSRWISFDLLNDDKLTNLRKEFFSITRTPMLGIPKVIDEFLEDDDFSKCQSKLQEYGDALRDGNGFITKMKARLDELAKTVK